MWGGIKMGYDNVQKDIQKREKAERKEALIKKTEEAAITRDEIYKLLPIHEEEAVSLADLKPHFPDKSNDHISANVRSLFNNEHIKRIKRYDSEVHPSLMHCYYWKDTEKTIVEILQSNGCEIDQDARMVLYETEKLYEMWKIQSPTYILNPMHIRIPTFRNEKDFIPPADTLAISSSLFQLLSDISEIFDEREVIKKISDIAECDGKKAKEIIRIAKDETIMNRINQGRVPDFIDSILTPIFKLLERARPTVREKGRFYEWIEEHGLKQRHITKNGASFFKEHDLEKAIVYDKRMMQEIVVQILDEASKNKNKAIGNFIINNLLTTKKQGRTIAELSGLSNAEYSLNTICAGLSKLLSKNKIKEAKVDGVFYYWKEDEIKETTIAFSPSKPSIKELISSYKASNKKLDERIANIEKQIADLGQKQELQAEMQKREENEKRLVELEEQLHKIAIADSSVKRGILH